MFELNDEYAESDIPTTLLRSKADCSTKEVWFVGVALPSYSDSSQQVQATLSTNDIVINKLTQILSYLRQGSLTKKKKKDKGQYSLTILIMASLSSVSQLHLHSSCTTSHYSCTSEETNVIWKVDNVLLISVHWLVLSIAVFTLKLVTTCQRVPDLLP